MTKGMNPIWKVFLPSSMVLFTSSLKSTMVFLVSLNTPSGSVSALGFGAGGWRSLTGRKRGPSERMKRKEGEKKVDFRIWIVRKRISSRRKSSRRISSSSSSRRSWSRSRSWRSWSWSWRRTPLISLEKKW